MNVLVTLALLVGAAETRADDKPTAEQVRFFEAKVRPVLVEHCYKCHSSQGEKGVKGGLALDTRAGILQGGDSGPVIVPGRPDESLLVEAIGYADEALQMPPKGKLSADAIADLRKWVMMGAPDPREGPAATPAARKAMTLGEARSFWAFQLPRKSEPPAVQDASWARTDIDRHLLAALEAKGLHPVGDADRRTLIRRANFDLLGLPPTIAEVSGFLQDTDPTPQAFAKVVDRLLASPRFGERWGRHWLDVARFAESSGKEQNLLYPHAWRYRDYVIAAFNADKPYDQFLKEQIAGDLMPSRDPKENAERLIATGYLAMGPKSHNTINPRQFRLDMVDEQIDALSQGMMGLTIACARCHDHKFDPFLQRDYYALAGILLSTDTRYGTVQAIQNRQPSGLIELPAAANVPDGGALTKDELRVVAERLDAMKKTRQDMLAEAREKRDPSLLQGNIRLIVLSTQISLLENRLATHDAEGRSKPLAMGVKDRLVPMNSPLYVRGELDKAADLVPRGFPSALGESSASFDSENSGRLELAEWVASRENPLTARVMANRVWLHLFGRGIVRTVDNFGTTGQSPSHPALLDALAISFVEEGWSVKALIRRIMASHAYQVASSYDPRNAETDPDNVLLWRMSPRRLEAEAVRDALLAVSGQLDLTPPVGSAVSKAGEGPVNLVRLTPSGAAFVVGPQLFGMGGPGQAPGQALRKGQGNAGPFRPGMGPGAMQAPAEPKTRSVYLPVIRDQVVDALAAFDFAEPSLVVGEREDTTVPSQALFLMNAPLVIRQAIALADKLIESGGGQDERVRLAFETVFSRPPVEAEIAAAKTFFKDLPERPVQPVQPGRPPLRPGFGPGQGPANPAAQLAADLPPLLDRQRAAWTFFCQSLFASAEFRYIH